MLTQLGCAKTKEDAKPAPEASKSATPEVQYPEDALICTDGALSVVAPPAPSPTHDGGIGLGRIGTGPFGFGYARTSISGRPIGGGPRAIAVARGACAAIPSIQTCRGSNLPEGSLEVELTVDEKGRATVAPKPHTLDPELVTCVTDTFAAATFDAAAKGTTPYSLTFSMLRPTHPRTDNGTVLTEMRLTIVGNYVPLHVKALIRNNHPRVRACYEAGLKKDPKLAGRVSLSFVIDKTGSARDMKLLDKSFPDEGVTKCIAKIFAGIAFLEPPTGTVQVQWMADLWKPDA